MIGSPLNTVFSFAAYPASFAWFYPILVLLSPFCVALIPPAVVQVLETVLESVLPKNLKRVLNTFCAVAVVSAIVVAIIYYRADYENAVTPALSWGVTAATWLVIAPVYFSLAAFGLYAYLKRRRIRDERVACGVNAFIKALAIFLPLIFLEQVMSAFRASSYLAQLWFSLFPIGLKFESGLFLTVALICQSRVIAALFHTGTFAAVAAPASSTGYTLPSDVESLRLLEGRFSGAGLSKREAEIAILSLNGKANKDIAARLGIAHTTVKNHLTSAYRKLGVASRWELLALSKEGKNGYTGK